MKVVIFGTGKMFYQYWKYIDKKQVVCLVDNDKEKVGMYIDDIEITLPNQLKNYRYDVVLVLSLYFEEMKYQLLQQGIPEEKILSYMQIGNVIKQPAWINSRGRKYTFKEWNGKCKEKKALLISHELSYTGAPIALMNMAKVMQKMDISVVYAGMCKGALQEELDINHIGYISNWMFIDTEIQKEYIREVDLVVISTFGMKWLVQGYKDEVTPIIWWIHETDAAYQEIEDLEFGKNVSVYCGGEYARRVFQSHCKGKHAQVLQYCIPQKEVLDIACKELESDTVTFGMIGTICERKAQDIFLKAILKLSPKYREKIRILMIGAVWDIHKTYWEQQKPLLNKLKIVKIMGEMSQEKLAEKYQEIDILVCPSREDPMPIVVTEAMMYGKICMLSQNVGQVEFVKTGVNGFVFTDEKELAEQIKWIINHKENIPVIGNCARQIYEQNFSEVIMEKHLKRFLQEKQVKKN